MQCLVPAAVSSRQLVSPRGDMYRLLTRDLREALREEDGEEQEEEQEEREQEEKEIDSMGILGLSNKLYKDTRYQCKKSTFCCKTLTNMERQKKIKA